MDKLLESKIEESHGILSMCSTHNLWALYSGGKDSIVAAHIVSQWLPDSFQGVIHVRTETGPKSVEQSNLAIDNAKALGWQVIEVSPNITYEMLVVKYGFPGPPSHRYMYQYLKERPLNQAKKIARKKGKSSKLSFVTGIRHAESQRRANAPEFSMKAGVRWISPLINWTQQDVLDYIETHNLNYEASQDCLCGAFAHFGEREEIREHHSGQAAYWDYLERMVSLSQQRQRLEADLGTFNPEKVILSTHCKWGHGLGSSSEMPYESDVISICNDCHGQLDENGNMGIDPDRMLLEYQRNSKNE